MKKQILFIHGGSAFTRYEDYIQSLRTSPIRDPYYLGSKKRWKDTLPLHFDETHDVLYPSMPNSHNAKYEEWKIWFERYFEYLNGDIILIGHSQGGIFLAKYLAENTPKINILALYLVAAPYPGKDLNDKYGEDGGDFNTKLDNAENIEDQCNTIYIFHSKDDPVVPVSHGTMYKKALKSATYIEHEDRGHFLQETFPELIKSIKETV